MKQVYKKPAIQEAVFEARFDNVNTFDLATPGQIYEKVKDKYPIKKDIKHYFFNLGTAVDGEKAPKIQSPSIQARKEDGSELLQVGPGIAVANRITYSTWEDFKIAIKTILEAYILVSEPQTMTRLGVRYINNFFIPEKQIRIADYFNIGAQTQTPPILGGLDAFDWTFVNSCKEDGFKVKTRLFTGSLLPEEVGNRILLDLDCYRDLPEINPRTKKILPFATQAHNIISETFESLITDSTRKLMGVVK